MAIMVAGGLTFAIPGADPAFAEVTKTNPHLFVSAEGQDADNQFAQGNIIEVIVNDATIGDTDEGEAEPNVSINGADLRMLQTANGDWRAYFAQADAIASIDAMNGELDYGVYCSETAASAVSTLALSDTNGVYFPPGSVSDTCTAQSANTMHPLIRETRDLTDYNPAGDTIGQLGLANDNMWPFIQVFDFASESKVTIVYDRAGSQETVTLEFDDPSESHLLDRAKYPQGAHVLVTLEDYALNIDPTDEDVWVFDTNAKAAYYNVFDEDGNALNIIKDTITDYAGSAGIGEQVEIVRNGQGGDPLIDCQVTKDFGIQEKDDASKDYLMVGDNGACLPNGNGVGAAASTIFTEDSFAIGFVEDGSNNNEFINWAEDQRANLVVRDDAQRNRSFEIDYNAPGAISGVVGHFSAGLTLDVPDDTWNSGERIGLVLTDMDANTNPLAENDLTVADPDSRLVPSIQIGNPITLDDVSGDVVWYDLHDVAPPPAPQTPNPVVMVNGDAKVMVAKGSTYMDAGATCTDAVDGSISTISSNANAIDTSKTGVQTITYSCTDSDGYTGKATRTVTVTDQAMPVITLRDGNTATVAQYGTYNDAGATCKDGDDQTVITTITSNASAIDTSSAGSQIIEYSCTDKQDNTHTAIRTVTVEDKEKPVIVITGDASIQISAGHASYEDQGAVCTDNLDANKTATAVSTVIAGTVGNYTVTYTCTDAGGNVADQKVRNVEVITDDVPPRITLTGEPVVMISHNAKAYTDDGAACMDELDGVITVSSDADAIDPTTRGNHTVTYTCTDAAGNNAEQVTRTVVVGDDTTDPVISGANDRTIMVNDSFDPKTGVTCTDDVSNPQLTIVGDVDTATGGDYPVAYRCIDDADNMATQFVTITVTSATTPEITISGGDAVREGGNAVFTITATPAPAAPLIVNLAVEDDGIGDFVLTNNEGDKILSVPTSGEARWTVITEDDNVDEDDGSVTVTVSGGAGYTVSATNGMATVTVRDNDGVETPVLPDLRISAGSQSITEGADAVFTITADSAPDADLDVVVTITDSGDYVTSTTGPMTVTIPADGTSATVTVATYDDNVYETDGTITATITADATKYTTSTDTATTAVTNDDPPVTTLTITGITGVWNAGNEVTLTITGTSQNNPTNVRLVADSIGFTSAPLSVDPNTGAITGTALIDDIRVSEDTEFKMTADGDVESAASTGTIPRLLTLTNLVVEDAWEEGVLKIVANGTSGFASNVKLIAVDADGSVTDVDANDDPNTVDDATVTTGKIGAEFTLRNFTLSEQPVMFKLQYSGLGGRTAESNAEARTLPALLKLGEVGVAKDWTGGSLTVEVSGTAGLSDRTEVQLVAIDDQGDKFKCRNHNS